MPSSHRVATTTTTTATRPSSPPVDGDARPSHFAALDDRVNDAGSDAFDDDDDDDENEELSRLMRGLSRERDALRDAESAVEKAQLTLDRARTSADQFRRLVHETEAEMQHEVQSLRTSADDVDRNERSSSAATTTATTTTDNRPKKKPRKETESSSWDEQFLELQRFKERNGHIFVPAQQNAPTRELGEWVIEQLAEYSARKENKTTSMTEERMALLESIGFNYNPGR